MKVIGILGGVAGGKSLVACELGRLGAGLLDADRAAHEVLRMPEIETAVRQRWGSAVFGADGRIDRARLAGIVFAGPPRGPRERRHLEQLTHPEIGRLLAQEAKRLEAPAGRRRCSMRRCFWRPVGVSYVIRWCSSTRRAGSGKPGLRHAVGARRIFPPVRTRKNR